MTVVSTINVYEVDGSEELNAKPLIIENHSAFRDFIVLKGDHIRGTITISASDLQRAVSAAYNAHK